MIVVALVDEEKYPDAVSRLRAEDCRVSVARSFTLKDKSVLRLLIVCDEMPKAIQDLRIESKAEEAIYCCVCGGNIQSNNKSGYCKLHREMAPHRLERNRTKPSKSTKE